MKLGTAGFTAALAIHRMEQNGLTPANGPVVVTGATGGVGSLAINMLAGRGYEVVAVSGKPEADDYLRELGAAAILRRQSLDLGSKPLEAVAMGRRRRQRRRRGPHVAHAHRGLLGQHRQHRAGRAAIELHTTVMPFILRGVNLLGINSVATPRDLRLDVWHRIATDLRPGAARPHQRPDRGVRRAAGAVRRLHERPRHRPHRREDRSIRSMDTRKLIDMKPLVSPERLTHLQRLEAESIHIMREVVAECEKPVMLYSIGKDSAVMLHLALKAFYPGAAAVPAAARRHDVEVPRDVRVPRPDGAASSASSCSCTSNPDGVDAGHQPVHARLGGPHRRDEDAGAEAGARQVRLRRGVRRRAPRRGEEPRQGAHLLVPLGAAPLGPEEPAPGALAPLQRAQAQGREHPRVPALELDRARRLAVHLPARTSRSCRSTSRRSGRSSSATAR